MFKRIELLYMLFQIENTQHNKTLLRQIFYSLCDLITKPSYEYRLENIVFIMHNQKELKLLEYMKFVEFEAHKTYWIQDGRMETASNIRKEIFKMDSSYKLVGIVGREKNFKKKTNITGEWKMWRMMVTHVI